MVVSDSLTVALTAILAGACLLYGLFVYLAKARGKRISLVTFLAFLGTLLLLCLDQMVVLGRISPVVPFFEDGLRLGAYLGATFVILQALDLLLIEAVLIDQKDLFLPASLRMVLVATGLVLAGVLLLHQVVGINVIALIAVPTILTAVVGLALKDTLTRVASGVMLGRMMREGDWVTLDGHEGRVAEISLGQITLHNRAGDAVMLPNDVVCQGVIENHNRPVVHHASTLVVEAAYAHSPTEVIKMLVETGRAVHGVLGDPQPVCYATAFKGSGIEYQLQFWFDDFTQRRKLESDVLTYVWHALRRNRIETPYQQGAVQPSGGASQVLASADGLGDVLRQLRSIDFLHVLGDSELESLARSAKTQVYLPGESVVQRGERGDEFFILSSGEAAVVMDAEGKAAEVARLKSGDFFGEMSLLTGEPRSATVLALTDLSLLVLDKAAMSSVFNQNHALIEQVGRVVQQRKTDLLVKLEAETRVKAEGRSVKDDVQFIDRIRDFFGL
jgi:small-conductance mechanosensitive channel/CRP-like cAMP-binding protein